MVALASVAARKDLRIALSPVQIELQEHAHTLTMPPATVHVTSAGTTMPRHRSAGATMQVAQIV
jgi:hypothetical protein